MYDYVLAGGSVVDGTAAPAVRADLAIKDGRIAAIGKITDAAARRIDVDGLVVSPGFVDVHTHYDAQINWDPELTPSSWHGVTTVIGGNCGFTVAPIDDSSADYVLRMLAVVEGIPYSALEKLSCDWSSFGSWLAPLDDQLAINAGFLVGHTTLRRLVMGDEAVGGQSDSWGPVPGAAATEAQLAAMERVLGECLDQGALGLSTSRSGHTDHFGLPVPSRFSTDEELLRLSAVLAGHPGTFIEFSPDELFAADFSEPMRALMAAMSTRADAPLIWNALNVGMGEAQSKLGSKLEASDVAERLGGRVVALTLPHGNPLRLNFETGISYDSIPGWAAVMHAPHEEKLRMLADPDQRAELRRLADRVPYQRWTHWSDSVVFDAEAPAVQRYVGRSIGEIAEERGTDPFDTLLDLVLADDLRTGVMTPTIDDYDVEVWDKRAALLADHRTVLGGSDAGAHLDMVQAFGCITSLVGPVVRDTGALTLEEAVHQATDGPARLLGLTGRGRLQTGWLADVIIFDPETFAPTPIEVRHDLPGGAWRLTSEAAGLEHVFVNGTLVREGPKFTGDRPGTVLRSGRDTSGQLIT